MNLGLLRQSLREEILDDAVEPFLWSDDTLNRYLNNAVREACIRARMLRDDASSATSVCRVAVDPATSGRVAIDPSIIAIRSGSLSDGLHPLWAVSSNDMDRLEPGWDAGRMEQGTPRYIVMDLAQKVVQLWPRPSAALTLQLRVWRMPLATELMVEDDDEPVVHLPDAEELRHWAAHEAFLKRDEDTINEDASSKHLALFEQRFGSRPSFHEMARWADSPPRVRRTTMF
ncbi:hypothetical protein [Dyella japonica]|uniref:Uncharacterized protein n=1 Tax=Dyella japonica DSM 16301 TaxID=1440762 RepID=A0A0G9HCJ7_9GAMM|nr:hypothetical protein [Dyella japonica]KLD65427.1 hypothetical protein Y882_02580 [Dyella japonica DSM 16301]